MSERYWLVQSNGARQLIDERDFDIARLAEQLRRVGGELVVESTADECSNLVENDGTPEDQRLQIPQCASSFAVPRALFEPPISALAPLFRSRLERLHACQVSYQVEMNTRPTARILGGYYRKRRLIRIYTHDHSTGRRPLAELFDTFLHEVAHHLEYTEPQTFGNRGCGRVRGRMHSPLFWQILGILKGRWLELQGPPSGC